MSSESASMTCAMVLHGHELRYVDRGVGPAVLFIHGLLSSNRQWAHLLDTLDSTHRVLAPDLFGHGVSAKPMGDYSLGAHAATLRDLLDELGIDQVTLVGHSLGGGIAMQFCYLFPDRVQRLVLVSSGGLGREVSALLRAATVPGAEWVLPLIASKRIRERVVTLGHTLARLGVQAPPELAEAWRGFTSLGDRDGRRAFLATTRSVVDLGGQSVTAHDYLPPPAEIRTLLVWGTRDRIIPAEHGAAAHDAIPGSWLELFEGARHFPHLEQPERFAKILNEFIAAA